MTKRINEEEDWLTAIVIHPGWVPTDMGKAASEGIGLPIEAFNITVDQSCDGMVHLIDVASKESHGGRFWDYDGGRESW